MAVKLKADHKGIKKSIQQENGKVWIRSIGKITNDICNEVHLKDLKKLLNRAQDLRNTKMHPNQNSFGGPSGAVRNIQYGVNVINRLFKHDEWHQKRYKALSDIKETISHLNKHLLVVTTNSEGHVIHSCTDYDLIDNTLLIACTPLIDVTKLEKDSNFLPDSIIYRFQDFTISKESISGISGDGKRIELTVTEHPESIRANKLYLQYLEELIKKEPFMHFDFISQDAGWKLVEEEYQCYVNKY